MNVRRKYHEVRDLMEPGDVIAFGGKGGISDLIKLFTRGEVSHVGVVLETAMLLSGERQKGRFVQVIESTSLNGFSGVSITRLSDRVEHYDGDVWWLPLRADIRETLDHKAFFDFLLHQERKPYDASQAIRSALDALDGLGITRNEEDYARFFCSELVAAGLKAGGAIPDHLNPSEVTPMELVRWEIFGGRAFQLKGELKEISGFNITTLVPDEVEA